MGAIFSFAIISSIKGISIHAIGDSLMIVGAIGVVVWLIAWAPWARRRRVAYRKDMPPAEAPGPPAHRYPADSRYGCEGPDHRGDHVHFAEIYGASVFKETIFRFTDTVPAVTP